MKLVHACAGIALSCQLLLPVVPASADTWTTAITKNNLGLGVITIDLKNSTLTLAPAGDKIVFTPSAAMSSLFFDDKDPSKHTFSFPIQPIPLGGGTFGTLTLTSVIGSNFGLTLGADGLEFTATMSVTATVSPSAVLSVATGYILPGGFDIFINSATIFANASLSGAGTSGGIHFNAPKINAPFSVSNCTAVLVSPFLATLPPFPPPVIPCDGIVTGLINANGGIGGRVSKGLGDALVSNWPMVVSGIESGIESWVNGWGQLVNAKPAKTDNKWKVVQGTIFTEAPCIVGKPGPETCLAFQVARKTDKPPNCTIKPDSCDYGVTFTCTGINADLGDKLQIYGLPVPAGGKPWKLMKTLDGDAAGKATVHLNVYTLVDPNGGPNVTEKFSFWNYDPQNKDNSAWDTEAQTQTVTLFGKKCPVQAVNPKMKGQ